MKILVLLVGMAVVAWLVATQLGGSAPAGAGAGGQNAAQLIEQTREKTKKIAADAQKQADQVAADAAETTR